MNLFSLGMPPLLLSPELLHFLVAPPLLPLVLLPQLTLTLLLLWGVPGEKKSGVLENQNTTGLARNCILPVRFMFRSTKHAPKHILHRGALNRVGRASRVELWCLATCQEEKTLVGTQKERTDYGLRISACKSALWN